MSKLNRDYTTPRPPIALGMILIGLPAITGSLRLLDSPDVWHQVSGWVGLIGYPALAAVTIWQWRWYAKRADDNARLAGPIWGMIARGHDRVSVIVERRDAEFKAVAWPTEEDQ